MFLLHHTVALHRKRLIRLALLAQVLPLLLGTLFTLLGLGAVGPGMVLYPVMVAGLITYWVIAARHFSPHSVQVAWKYHRALARSAR